MDDEDDEVNIYDWLEDSVSEEPIAELEPGELDLSQFAEFDEEEEATEEGAEETAEHIVVPGVDEYQVMVEHFADLVLGGVKPLVPLEDSIHNLSVLDALGEAAKNDTSVSVDCGNTGTSGMP